MRFLFLCFFGILLEYCKSHDTDDKLRQVCRDNEDKPVPWWFIYKPPADVIPPYSGKNFTYITPYTNGRWRHSKVDITDNNMISYTLMPSYKNKVDRAVVKFEAVAWRRVMARTSSRGVMMAGQEGGFLLTHSVPGFPGAFSEFTDLEELFPTNELANGHLLTCLTLGFEALNEVGRAIRYIAPNFIHAYVPDKLRDHLPEWQFDDYRNRPSSINDRIQPLTFFLMKGNQSHILGGLGGVAASLVAQPRGVKSSIYTYFAARQMIMLNVYGQSQSTNVTSICGDGFGVRNIDSLCLKYKRRSGKSYKWSIFYVTNSTDYSWFAVSAAQNGASPRQFWVCTSQVDKEDLSGEGGLLLCVMDYNLWVAFDNLKMNEPSLCPHISQNML